jgi:hypothetical protein
MLFVVLAVIVWTAPQQHQTHSPPYLFGGLLVTYFTLLFCGIGLCFALGGQALGKRGRELAVASVLSLQRAARAGQTLGIIISLIAATGIVLIVLRIEI